MALYGLIGNPLEHSFSKRYFSEKFEREGIENARYKLFPLDSMADLPMLLAQNHDLYGLNVTIPYKESVIPLLHQLDKTAQSVGAVNCIKIIENQQLIGYNTDVIGFEKSLQNEQFIPWKRKGNTALILGTGGASKAVAFVLKKLGIDFIFVSRHPQNKNEISYSALSYDDLSFPIADHVPTMIINTTPLGTFPHVNNMPPIPPDYFMPNMFVYDLIYNPAETLFLREAKIRGCRVKNGLEMLKLQAEAAWEIWQRED